MGLNWSTLHSPANSEGPERLACWRVADECDDHCTIAASAYPRCVGPRRTVTVSGILVGGPSRKGCKGERRRDPVVRFGRLLLPAGEFGDATLRGIAVDSASAAGRVELRDVAGHRRAAAAEGAAVAAEGPGSDDAAGPAGWDRRPRFRYHLPRPALRAPVAGQRRAAPRADRPAGRPPA